MLLCVDTSAWHHAADPGVADQWQLHLEGRRLGICDQVRLEILWSARSADDYRHLADELLGLWTIPSGAATWTRALEVQRQLSEVAGLHHRSVKIADLLIAAAAEAADATVWHYDQDFDRIAGITGQPTTWIAPPGSL